MKRLLAVLPVMLVAAAALIVNRNEAAGVTFTKDVAPIIFNKCANCHRQGEVAPMPFTSYAEVRLQLATPLRTGRAAEDSRGQQTGRARPLRQLDQEPLQPRSRQRSLLERAE